jgi:hypothetical protein
MRFVQALSTAAMPVHAVTRLFNPIGETTAN